MVGMKSITVVPAITRGAVKKTKLRAPDYIKEVSVSYHVGQVGDVDGGGPPGEEKRNAVGNTLDGESRKEGRHFQARHEKPVDKPGGKADREGDEDCQEEGHLRRKAPIRESAGELCRDNRGESHHETDGEVDPARYQ